MSQSGSAVATAFGVQLTVAVLVFLIFSWLRSRKSLRRFYAPRRYDKTREYRPRKLGAGPFGWMTTVYTYPEEEFIKVAGPDSTVYVRVLQFGWEVFFKVTIVTCVLLLPVHLTGNQVDVLLQKQAIAEAAGKLQVHQPFRRLAEQQQPMRSLLQLPTTSNTSRGNNTAAIGLETSTEDAAPACGPPPTTVDVIRYAYTTFDRLSLVNLPDGSRKFWAHIACVYIVTYVVLTKVPLLRIPQVAVPQVGLVIKTLSRFNKKAVQLRMEHFANVPFGCASHSVLITDIPGMRYGTLIWYLQSLVGSSWFFLVPKKYKKQVMESIETGAEAVVKAHKVDCHLDYCAQVVRAHEVDVGAQAEFALRRAATKGKRITDMVRSATARATSRGKSDTLKTESVVTQERNETTRSVSLPAAFRPSQTPGDDKPLAIAQKSLDKTSLAAQHLAQENLAQTSTSIENAATSQLLHSPFEQAGLNVGSTVRLTAANISVNTMLSVLAEHGSTLVADTAPDSTQPLQLHRRVTAQSQKSGKGDVRVDVLLEDGTSKSDVLQRSEVVATCDALDPWQQAYAAFGKHANPPVDKVAAFIHTELERAYGKHTIAAVNMIAEQNGLDSLLDEYKSVRQKLEDHLDHVVYKLKSEKPVSKRHTVTVVGPTLGSWGIQRYGMKAVKVDAIEHWVARLEHLCDVIPEAQKVASTRATQVAMSNSLHHHDETTWQLQAAPEPQELIWAGRGCVQLIWSSLKMRRWEREVRTVVMWGVYFVLMVTFMIPVTIVQNYMQTGVQEVHTPFAAQVLQSIIPGLALVIFLLVLPYILVVMCRLSGFVSISAIDFGVTKRYFFFQVVGFFLGSVIAASLWEQVKQFVRNPGSLLDILGDGLPSSASFFVNWGLVVGVGKTGIKHLRLAELAYYLVASKVAATRRAKERLWMRQYIWFSHTVPDFTIFFLLGLVYCCLNPIITPAVLLFYTFTIMSKRYNMLYVYTPKYETGGKLWYPVFHQFIVGLYFMQVVMIVVLSQRGFNMAVLIIPALIISILFHISTMRLYRRPLKSMAAHDAAVLDELDEADRGTSAVTSQEATRIHDMYQSPALKFKPEDVQGLLREARIVAAALGTQGAGAVKLLDEQLSCYTADDTATYSNDNEDVGEEEEAPCDPEEKAAWEGAGEGKGAVDKV